MSGWASHKPWCASRIEGEYRADLCSCGAWRRGTEQTEASEAVRGVYSRTVQLKSQVEVQLERLKAAAVAAPMLGHVEELRPVALRLRALIDAYLYSLDSKSTTAPAQCELPFHNKQGA